MIGGLAGIVFSPQWDMSGHEGTLPHLIEIFHSKALIGNKINISTNLSPFIVGDDE
jgi:hypothetical protein